MTLLEHAEMKVNEPAVKNSWDSLSDVDFSNISSNPTMISTQDLHSPSLQKLAQPEENLRGRPIYRSGIGSRKSEELLKSVTETGARISQERSVPRRKSMR